MWESLSVFGSLGNFILDKSESTIVALALGVMVYFFNKYIKPRLKAGTEKEIAERLLMLADDITDYFIALYPDSKPAEWMNEAVDKLCKAMGVKREVAERVIRATLKRKK